jgi:hypothetical protein
MASHLVRLAIPNSEVGMVRRTVHGRPGEATLPNAYLPRLRLLTSNGRPLDFGKIGGVPTSV